MQKEQKMYTKEFTVEAVFLLESSQKSQAQIAANWEWQTALCPSGGKI